MSDCVFQKIRSSQFRGSTFNQSSLVCFYVLQVKDLFVTMGTVASTLAQVAVLVVETFFMPKEPKMVKNHDEIERANRELEAKVRQDRAAAQAERDRRKREIDKLKREADEARRQVEEANQVANAARQLKDKADEEGRQAEFRAAEARRVADRARHQATEANKRREQAELEEREAKGAVKQVKEALRLAVLAKKRDDEARKALLEKDWGPRPSYIPDYVFSIGFAGKSGVGKTSLWNSFVKHLFLKLVPESQQTEFISSVPLGRVGAVETTREVMSYQLPGTSLLLSDLPGHATLHFQARTYVRDFSIGYYDIVLYVYSGRLNDSDVGLLLNFILYDIPFRLVRQKFHQDILTFAGNHYRANHEVGPFNDNGPEMQQAVNRSIEDPTLIAEAKKMLHEEVIENWTDLLDATESSVVQRRRGQLIDKIEDPSISYCIDSKHGEKYDCNAILEDARARMVERSSVVVT